MLNNQKNNKISNYILFISLAVIICLLTLLDTSFAASLEKQLDTVNTMANDKAKKVFLTLAFLISSIVSVVKGNVKMIFVIVAILGANEKLGF